MVLDGPCEDATSTPTVRSIYRVAECSEIPPVGIAASSPLSPGTTDAVGTATERHRTDGGPPQAGKPPLQGDEQLVPGAAEVPDARSVTCPWSRRPSCVSA